MAAYKTYTWLLHCFHFLKPEEQRIIAASPSAVECWLYNQQILPSEQDIKTMHNLMNASSIDDVHAYLNQFPLHDLYFNCYTPMKYVIGNMRDSMTHGICRSESNTDEEIAFTLFLNAVGFKLAHRQFAIDFANSVLIPDLPQESPIPEVLRQYESIEAWHLIEYPKNFVFHTISVQSMPEIEKTLLSAKAMRQETIEWFHRENWFAGKNPVDAFH